MSPIQKLCEQMTAESKPSTIDEAEEKINKIAGGEE